MQREKLGLKLYLDEQHRSLFKITNLSVDLLLFRIECFWCNKLKLLLLLNRCPQMLQMWHLYVFSLSAGGGATEELWLSLSQGCLAGDKL